MHLNASEKHHLFASEEASERAGAHPPSSLSIKSTLKTVKGRQQSRPALLSTPSAFRHGRSSALTLQQRDDEYISIFFLWLRPGETRREPGNQSYSFSRKIHHK